MVSLAITVVVMKMSQCKKNHNGPKITLYFLSMKLGWNVRSPLRDMVVKIVKQSKS